MLEIIQKPKVSISMITYNHEAFITEFIEGVLRLHLPTLVKFGAY
jgi:hypothetical protein